MRPEEFLKVAEELASKDGEAFLRTAISRIYFALFHNGRNVLRMHRIPVPKSRDAHYIVPEELRALAHDEHNVFLEQLADEIETLRDIRDAADYDIHIPLTRLKVKDRLLKIDKQWILTVLRRVKKLKEQV